MKELKAVPVDTETTVKIDTGSIPAHVAVNIAQSALAAIQQAFLRPEIQEDFQRWKARKEQIAVCGMEERCNEK